MTNSIIVNNKVKLQQITLTEEHLMEECWLNVFYQHDDGESGVIEEILYLTRNFNEYYGCDELLEAVNKSELFDGEYNDVATSDEGCLDAGDTVWALVDR
mgnify:CR=1 FL=1|tara:strand:+ start:353 stop:652 length:300 start_codon:yes stop_codon:yes gene_type:complete